MLAANCTNKINRGSRYDVEERPNDEQLWPFLLLPVPSWQRSRSCPLMPDCLCVR